MMHGGGQHQWTASDQMLLYSIRRSTSSAISLPGLALSGVLRIYRSFHNEHHPYQAERQSDTAVASSRTDRGDFLARFG